MAATTVLDGRALLDRLASTELAALAAHFNANGVRLHLVGGPVRDLLCGLTPKDLDVTSPAHPERFAEILETFTLPGVSVTRFDVGEAHGTTGVLFTHRDGTQVDVEHTTHRTEVYLTGSRVPDVEFGSDLAADLARRDFTVNAIALDLVTGACTDLFGGAQDLERGVLRCPEDPARIFDEDPLRICRLVRFAATRGWSPDGQTASAARLKAHRLAAISRERIAAELWRICDTGGAAVSAAVELCEQLELTNEVLGVPAGAVPTGIGEVSDPDALRIVLARCADDLDRWLTMMRASRDVTRVVSGAVELLDLLDRDALDPVVVRRRGHRVATVARDAAAAFDLNSAQLAGMVANPALFGALPVSGGDALAAGLKGPAVGAALAAVTAAFCADTSLGRDAALEIIASTR